MVGQKPLIQETVKDRGLPRGSGSAIRDWVRWFGQGQFSKVVLGWTDEGVCHYMVVGGGRFSGAVLCQDGRGRSAPTYFAARIRFRVHSRTFHDLKYKRFAAVDIFVSLQRIREL